MTENEKPELTKEEWNIIYNELMGGFENIEDTDDEEEEYSDDYPDEMLTEHGYLKDDFVVDDNELEPESYESE